MSPIAGKPPFATDEPDSFYETPRPPQPRIRQPAPPNPNSRTSAYDVYENYLADDKNKLSAPSRSSAATNRDSGIGALGMGLLNMGDDSDDDSDDEDIPRKPTIPPPGIAPLSKNAALAAATGVATPTSPSSQPSPPPPQAPPQAKPPQQDEKRQPPRGLSPNPSQGPPPPPPYVQQMRAPMPPPQQQLPPRPLGPPHPQQQQMQMHNNPPHPANQRPPPPGPQPIAAPRPGYAAPIAALNLARPEAAAAPGGRQGGAPPPPPLTIQNQNPFEPAFAGPGRPPGSLSPTPHPLLPPVTPITPAFIRPASKSPTPINVSFKEGVATPRPRKPIMRGNSEETLLPSRGEKGDDFWRRFSMVAKQDSRKKESSWLKKTRDGSERHSRSVWIVGIILLLCIGAGITLGVYFSRKSPGNQQPTAMGGSADNTAGPPTTTAPAAKKTGAGASGLGSSVLHVSPTNTVARRLVVEGVPTPTPAPFVLRMHAKRRLDARDVW